MSAFWQGTEPEMPPRNDLTENEKTILDMIVANPFSSQKELSERCGLPRPTLAAHIGQLTRKGYLLGRAYVVAEQGRFVCIGGAAIDRKFCLAGPMVPGTSNPAVGHTTFGGVARNVCENLVRLGQGCSLLSVVGDDHTGHALVEHIRSCGADTSRILFAQGQSTAEYVAILDSDFDLGVGVFDSSVSELLNVEYLQKNAAMIASAKWVFADCNVSPDVLAWLVTEVGRSPARLVFDTVSISKARRLRGHLHGVDVLFTNRDEAILLLDGAQSFTIPEIATALVRAGVGTAIITEGSEGLTVADSNGARRIPAVSAAVIDVTGAGDALVAATLTGLMAGEDIDAACRQGIAAAAMTIGCRESVNPELTHEALQKFMKTPVFPSNYKEQTV